MEHRTRVLRRIAVVLAAIAAYAVAATLVWAMVTSRNAPPVQATAFSRLATAIGKAVVDDKTGLVTKKVCGFTPGVQSYSLFRDAIRSVARCLRTHGYLSAHDVTSIEADTTLASVGIECRPSRQEGDERVFASCSFFSGSTISVATSRRLLAYEVAWLAGLVIVAWLTGIRLSLKVASIATGVLALTDAVVLVVLS